jgi:nitrite reductase (NADH) small subunit
MSDTPADDDSLRRVADLGDVPAGDSSVIEVGGERIALFNLDGEYYALDNVCPHQGGPLGNGRVEDNCVYCPWHGWQFDVETGEHVQGEDTVGTYEVVTDTDGIYIRVS